MRHILTNVSVWMPWDAYTSISWGKVATASMIATKEIVALIHDNFASRVEMVAYQNEFKYNLRKSLSEADQEILFVDG